MIGRLKNIITAILTMAVMFIGCWLGGCATHRQAQDLLVDTRTLKTDNANTRALLARMDSIITFGAEADNRLRAEMSTSVDELHHQIARLLENYTDLMVRLNECCQGREVIYVKGSPGAQTDPVGTSSDDKSPSSIDCDQTYDDAFILVRQLEYDKAISGFRNFLESCERHDNVPNAHYWIGESYYMQDKFAEAIVEFDVLADDFRSSANIDRALYKLARSHEELGHKDQAKTVYQQLIEDYPGTLSAEQARDRLKEF
jgi:tol-pal system protein YbgF